MEKTVISFHNFVTLTGSEIECVYSMRNSEYVRKNCDNSSVFSYESHLKFVSGLKGNNSKRYYLIKIDWHHAASIICLILIWKILLQKQVFL